LPLTDTPFPVPIPEPSHPDVPSPVLVDFLRLQLVPEMPALLPTQHTGGVFTLQMGQITPIPHMPAWVVGAYNWRGVILWMVDSGHLCGLSPWYQQVRSVSVHTVVVLQIPDREPGPGRIKYHTLGLLVHEVEGIESCDLESVEATPSTEDQPFLQGYWQQSPGDKIPILDGEAILATMPKA
jgi:positive phototaxis protein PixI